MKITLIKACLLSVILLFLSCNSLTQEEINKIIDKSEQLKSLDVFCTELPKPVGFKFAYKQIGGNSGKRHITHYYKAEIPFSDAKNFYVSFFKKESWIIEKLSDENKFSKSGFMKFRRDSKSVDIEHVSFPDSDYAIGCGEEI